MNQHAVPALTKRKIPLTVRYLILREASAPIIQRKRSSEPFPLQGKIEQEKRCCTITALVLFCCVMVMPRTGSVAFDIFYFLA